MNRPTKIFLSISGVYLFLLTFFLLFQPRNGETPNLERVWFYCLEFLPLWALIVGAIFLSRKYKDRNWHKKVFGKTTLFLAILLLVIVGFAFNLDYKREVGSLVLDEFDFSTTKFILSGGSILLLSAGYYFSKNTFGVSLLIIEFALWSIKAVYFNSALNLFLPGYFTMLFWALRLWLIAQILNNRESDSTIADIEKNS